ncbi:exosome component Rrp46 [Agrocybe pediades]|nr:exosome component Rrp46 [Agrocybe pediades]
MTDAARRDGRQPGETRPLEITFPGLARVDGSAKFSFGDAGALASVSGPIEVRLAAELPSKATFEVMVRPLSNVPGTDSKSLATTIRSSLEPSLILTKSPRSLVQLVIQTLSSSHTVYGKDALSAAMINAGSLALLKEGSVPMKGVVTAVAVGRLPSGTLVLDPSGEEAEKVQGGGVFAFFFADALPTGDCVWTGWKSTSGKYNEKELLQARELARAGAKEVYMAMRRGFTAQSIKQEVLSQPEAVEVKEDSDAEDKMEI